MATYTLINGTEATMTDVNVGGVDVGAMSYRDGVTMTDAELATFCGTLGCAATKDGTGVAFKEQIKRAIGIASMYLNPLA